MMKLFHSPASPFVRKVLVAAHERGIAEGIELVPTGVTPVRRDEAIAARNPLGKIPTLVLEDGTAVFDSRVIVEYLDGLPGGPRLIPEGGAARLKTLTLQALADGLCDAAVALRYETALRPEHLRWAEWSASQTTKVVASLDALERDWVPHLSSVLDIGVIAAACALGYLDLRFASLGWREGRAGLSAWYTAFAERPSMRATAPG
ncbi:MAG: glutathione S-transferase [Acetobacteraceae bacterium]|nr:glutathione S-transferase [Acetobacteraceae bacterium]